MTEWHEYEAPPFSTTKLEDGSTYTGFGLLMRKRFPDGSWRYRLPTQEEEFRHWCDGHEHLRLNLIPARFLCCQKPRRQRLVNPTRYHTILRGVRMGAIEHFRRVPDAAHQLPYIDDRHAV